MLLKEWEIWDTYSTFFIDPIVDLTATARNLIQTGLIESAFLDDGNYFRREGDEVIAGTIKVSLDPNLSEATFNLSEKILDGFAGETLMQSAYFRFAELKQFGESKNFPIKYIRGHIGECRLMANDYTYCIYPSIKLYNTGVLLVELRLIQPDRIINTEEFIEQFLNLYKIKFHNILVPPSLHINGQHAHTSSEKSKWPFLLRFGSWLVDREVEKYVKENKFKEMSGDFEFNFVPLWEIKHDNNTEVRISESDGFLLEDLILTIFQSVGVAASGLRRGKSLLFSGPNKSLKMSSRWRGHPHTYIIKFNGQANLVQQNERKFKRDFESIMAGVYIKAKEIRENYLPANSRNFDDYGAYIANQRTLWVWSKTGLDESKKWEVPNHGHLIYLHQSVCEMLDYGISLHQRMLDLVSNLDTLEEALNAKQTLVNLEMEMQSLSPYGEITHLLQKGWDDMGVGKLRSTISEIIALKQIQASVSEQRQSFILQTVLTLVFGLLAIPNIASDLIKPIWEVSGLARMPNESLATLIDMAVTFPLVFSLIFVFWKILKKKQFK